MDSFSTCPSDLTPNAAGTDAVEEVITHGCLDGRSRQESSDTTLTAGTAASAAFDSAASAASAPSCAPRPLIAVRRALSLNEGLSALGTPQRKSSVSFGGTETESFVADDDDGLGALEAVIQSLDRQSSSEESGAESQKVLQQLDKLRAKAEERRMRRSLAPRTMSPPDRELLDITGSSLLRRRHSLSSVQTSFFSEPPKWTQSHTGCGEVVECTREPPESAP